MSVYLLDHASERRTGSRSNSSCRPSRRWPRSNTSRRNARSSASATDFPELRDVTDGVGAQSVSLRARGAAADGERRRCGRGRSRRATSPARPGVADVRYDRRWLARLVGLVTTARFAAGLVGGHPDAGSRLYRRSGGPAVACTRGAMNSRSCSWSARHSVISAVPRSSRACCSAASAPRWHSRRLPSCISCWPAVGPESCRALPIPGRCGFSARWSWPIILLGGVGVGAAAGTVASRSVR